MLISFINSNSVENVLVCLYNNLMLGIGDVGKFTVVHQIFDLVVNIFHRCKGIKYEVGNILFETSDDLAMRNFTILILQVVQNVENISSRVLAGDAILERHYVHFLDCRSNLRHKGLLHALDFMKDT